MEQIVPIQPGSSRRTTRARWSIALLLAGTAPAVAACGFLSSFTGPSSTAPEETWRRTLPDWSPYLVIQPDSAALGGYDQALTTLVAHGGVRGARIGLYMDGSSASTVKLVASHGLEVVGIIDDADLFNPDVAAVFDQYAARYPEVKIFQVGNEITTQAPRMTIDQYLDVLERVYAHVRDRYAEITLVSQATFGAGTLGADDLAATARRLAAMGASPRRLIVGINVYTQTALGAYAAVLADKLTDYRIWVTETAVADPGRQVAYVTTTYPQLRTLVRAERIYWYALWAGDVGGDSAFSLITGPTHPPVVPGPLFQRLTDG